MWVQEASKASELEKSGGKGIEISQGINQQILSCDSCNLEK
jgi:hypothetical protein